MDALLETARTLTRMVSGQPQVFCVLMVDDAEDDFYFTQRALNTAFDEGYTTKKFELEHCKTTRRALAMLPNPKYACILIDWKLGYDGAGVDLVKELLAKGVRTPMLILSSVDASLVAKAQEEMLEAGIGRFVNKSIIGKGELARQMMAAIKSKK